MTIFRVDNKINEYFCLIKEATVCDCSTVSRIVCNINMAPISFPLTELAKYLEGMLLLNKKFNLNE